MAKPFDDLVFAETTPLKEVIGPALFGVASRALDHDVDFQVQTKFGWHLIRVTMRESQDMLEHRRRGGPSLGRPSLFGRRRSVGAWRSCTHGMASRSCLHLGARAARGDLEVGAEVEGTELDGAGAEAHGVDAPFPAAEAAEGDAEGDDLAVL